jgi:hypothetical protein
MKCKYAELNQPLFLGSKNLSQKLDAKRNVGLKLDYDEKLKELTVTWNGQRAIFPNFNGYVVEWDESEFKQPVTITVPQGKIKAQVSTPTGIKND